MEQPDNFIPSLIQSKSFYLGRSKCLGSGWLYEKTKGTLWSPTSQDLSDSIVESPLFSIKKKLQRPKVVKILNGILKNFSLDDFLGSQQSLGNIKSS